MAINRIKTGGITDGTITTTDIAPGTIANDRLAGSIANAKLANSAITINGTSIALGASGEIVAGTDWQAVTVADGSTTLTVEAGKGYFLDTNTGVIEVFLPTSPSRGDTIILVDYAGTFGTNQVIVNTGTNNLDSTTTRQYVLTTNDTIAEFVYVDSAKGWITRINTTTGTTPSGAFNTGGGYDTKLHIQATGGTVTTSGDYKIHTFTGDGCFVVTCAGQGTTNEPSIVDYLVIAGGGSGGIDNGGGGGAGGYRESRAATSPSHTQSPHTASPLASSTGITVTAQTYPITVGAGGPEGPGPVGTEGGVPGSNSVFSTITSAGGGGGSHNNTNSCTTAMSGGSGGGGGQGTPSGTKGSGNTPPVSPPQGNPGGYNGPGSTNGGGGGGGAGAPGNGGSSTNGYDGGAGVTSCITGSPVARAGGGGGGGGQPGSASGGAAGSGGGGAGGPGNGKGCAGTANTGGGGGGGGQSPPTPRGNNGGKGVVIIRYKYQN